MLALNAEQSAELLRTVVHTNTPAILSYLSMNKWHVSKVLFVDFDGQTIQVESIHTSDERQPINIQVGQPVGLSFKYSYGKFVFDATVNALEPSKGAGKAGSISLNCPAQIKAIQRRSYYRVQVPDALQVDVALWHRSCRTTAPDAPHDYHEGRLTDISAGGAMLALPMAHEDTGGVEARPDFHRGQYIGLRFTPLPYEKPLVFYAQIRNILPTADNTALCLGLQIVGLEASPEGQRTLARIVDVAETYHEMNETGQGPQEMASGATARPVPVAALSGLATVPTPPHRTAGGSVPYDTEW